MFLEFRYHLQIESTDFGKTIQITEIHEDDVSNGKYSCFSIILYKANFSCEFCQRSRTSLMY